MIVERRAGARNTIRRHRRGVVRRGQLRRLLLMSANEKHPHGLANGSDKLGRHYMYHNTVAVVAVSRREPNPTVFQKTLTIE